MMSQMISINSQKTDVEPLNDRILAHMDIDMFFAAVEILHDPTLKGKPLVVGNPNARQTGRGVVLTSSYEARKFGVSSGMSMNEALKKCPQMEISNSGRKYYKEYSDKIMSILEDIGAPLKKTSIDEAYIDLTNIVSNYKEAFDFAKSIQKQIFDATNLTVSIGIGSTLKIAKIASDYNKPNGITIVSPDNLKEFFKGLALRKIPGIGKVASISLEKKGYTHCDQIFHMSQLELIHLFGSTGDYFYKIFNCKTSNKIEHRSQQKSLGHESTFHGKPNDLEFYNNKLTYLFEKTYQKLIDKNYSTNVVTVKIRFNGYETITRAQSIALHTNSKDILWKITNKLIQPYFADRRGLRLIGVNFGHLELMNFDQKTLNDFF
jgi:DNA polymerase IV (archaeal DinB-like DNA polymerase)